MAQPKSAKPKRRLRWARKLLFRLAAVMIALVPFVLAEVTFAIFGWGRPDYSHDPFVGFRDVRPLFALNEEGTRYEEQYEEVYELTPEQQEEFIRIINQRYGP